MSQLADVQKRYQVYNKKINKLVYHQFMCFLGRYLNNVLGQHRIFNSSMAVTIQPVRPAKTPSKVFLGLI